MTTAMSTIRGIANIFSADWVLPSGKPESPRTMITILDVLGPKEPRG